MPVVDHESFSLLHTNVLIYTYIYILCDDIYYIYYVIIIFVRVCVCVCLHAYIDIHFLEIDE